MKRFLKWGIGMSEKKAVKTAPKSRAGTRKKVSEGNMLSEEKGGLQAKKRAAAKNAKTTRGSGGKQSKSTSDLSGGCAAMDDNKTGADKGKSRTKPAKADVSANAPKQVIFSLQAGTPIYVKTADICAATGKTNQWIGQLTAQGVIHKTNTSHGSLYELFDTLKAYCAMLEERAKRLDDDTAQIELKRKKAEAKLKESKAAVAELEAKEFQGKMHRSEDIQAMTADLMYFIRGGLMALAGRCANDCAASSEPAEIQKIIEREVFSILEDMANYKYSKERYDELVRRRMNRELDVDYFADEDEE